MRSKYIRHPAKLRGDRSKRRRDVAIFQDGGLPHLGFLKGQNFKGRKGQEGQFASSCQISWRSVNPLQRYDNFFDFSKMGAVRHVGFAMRVLGPPTEGIWWSLLLCKIWLESITV